MEFDSNAGNGRIVNTIIMPVIGIVVLAVLFVFAILVWSSKVTDEAAVTSQSNLLREAIQLQLDQVAKQQEGAAVWDDAFFRAERGLENRDWLRHHVAAWLAEGYGHSRSLILDSDRSVLVVYDRSGDTGWASEALLNALKGPIARVRARYINSFVMTPSGTYKFQPVYRNFHHSLFETGVVRIDAAPYYFSVTAIAPDLHTIGADREPPAVIVSFVPLNSLTLGRLAEMAGLDGIAATQPTNTRPGMADILLKDPGNTPVVRLNWNPTQPGSAMLNRLLPVMVILALAIAVLTAVLLNYARQSTRRLARSEAKAVYASQHDSLTGLPNRDFFTRMLTQALAAQTDERDLTAVVYIDLDHFKDINDTLGHAAGDEVLRAVTARLRGVVPPTGLLARISGDEFAMVLSQCSSRALIEYQLSRVQDELIRPVKVAGTELFVSLSMGAAIAPQDGTGAGELLRKADIALYDAKANGRGRWSFFDPAMEEYVQTRDNIARELRRAIDNDALAVAYQPQLSSKTGKITAVETLVRWTHPERGPISPANFVPIAEETGLINDLGLWVLRRACRDAHLWPDVMISVNISPTQFRHPRFIDQLIETLASYDLPPSRLEIEVTESVFAGKDAAVLNVMKRLRELGVKIALDDFGSGYSSLSYLRRFPFDILKIDRDFILPAGDSAQAQAILRTIIDLGEALDMTVVAEGIETSEQMDFLTSIGCERLQGYFISRPGPAEEVAPMIVSGAIDSRVKMSTGRLRAG
ncbi:putative bifunctional diguanylate cyclase/phosphodiesterase [Pannonibacter tanglangensis]|uniref:EAL domain-containing protein n=1 Tax=Pannonibacter tanglangensis TaxID=2750084 RepID=A0ABW9ZKQ1_9HYPH|nr:EAL domain-containing protein [Pannonibacter sp. XCT-34]NBN63617.1 EAL domain-containing protein [Pannonibacter sp. XCT-34]